jgi:hypothetical protein
MGTIPSYSAVIFGIIIALLFTGGATVPMATVGEDKLKKEFASPPPDTAG